MSKWIDFTIDERKAMIQAVSEEKQIDEASAEKEFDENHRWVFVVRHFERLSILTQYVIVSNNRYGKSQSFQLFL